MIQNPAWFELPLQKGALKHRRNVNLQGEMSRKAWKLRVIWWKKSDVFIVFTSFYVHIRWIEAIPTRQRNWITHWKINMLHLKITQLNSGKTFETNLHDFEFQQLVFRSLPSLKPTTKTLKINGWKMNVLLFRRPTKFGGYLGSKSR